MNLSLTTPVAPRSESLAFLSLSANDLDCLENSLETPQATRTAESCVVPSVPKLTEEDKARIALCDLIRTIAECKSADEFVGRRDRLFARYVDLMLGLGRILNALTDRAELTRKVKAQLELAERFFSDADKQFCPPHLKDQAIFSIWELCKVVDLADFINSRPPLPEAKREEDLRLSTICTMELLTGRVHLDCLIYAISKRIVQPEDIREVITEGIRHFVNGHIAVRFGARLRQESVEEAPVALLPLDEEDRMHLSHAMTYGDGEEY